MSEPKKKKKHKAGKSKDPKKSKPLAKTKIPKTAKASSAVKTAKPAKTTRRSRSSKSASPSPEAIATRAYYISQRRHTHGQDGDPHSDWVEAERQLRSESRRS